MKNCLKRFRILGKNLIKSIRNRAIAYKGYVVTLLLLQRFIEMSSIAKTYL